MKIICYMMTSVDGRIDCAMTAQLKGNSEYYANLDAFDFQATVSGRTTAELEMALSGKFEVSDDTPIGQEAFSKKTDAKNYNVIMDTKGSLLWPKETSTDRPHLIITSTQAPKAYFDYLDGQNISWIACGKDKIDLNRAVTILAEQFGVTRLGIVGGPTINTAFLNAGLIDEVVILIGPGIDGRASMPSVFEGRTSDTPLPLTLADVKAYDDGAVRLRYTL